MIEEHTHLSNLQKEILKIYSKDVEVKELNEIKNLLAKYYADKAVNEADKVWKEKKYSDEEMDKWLDE